MNKQTNRSPSWLHPDIPRVVRVHLLGENHTPRHKFLFGSFIMFFGISLVHVVGPILGHVFFHIVTDYVGYTLHAVGAIPIIKSVDKEGKL